MAELVAGFTTSIHKGKLTIVDASTPDYGEQTITNRVFKITFSNGEEDELDWPIDNGVGDELVYETDFDRAVTAELILTPEEEEPDSTYTKSEYLLLASFVTDCLYERRINNILDTDPKNILSDTSNEIETIEKVSSFYDAAVQFISLGELTSAQEALDMANSICNSPNCNC